MNEYDTLENIRILYGKVNGVFERNCFFVCYRDTVKDSLKSALPMAIGGAVGGMVGGVVASELSHNPPKIAKNIAGFIYDAFLINWSDNGLGIIPLQQKGLSFSVKLEKLFPKIDKYTFLSFNDIVIYTKKESENKIKIKLVFKENNYEISLFANLHEDSIPYHETSINYFYESFKNE